MSSDTAHDKARKASHREAGLCGCGRPRTTPHRCDACQEAHREAHRKAKADALAAGMCFCCMTRPVRPQRTTCAHCAALKAKAERRRAAARKVTR